MSTRHRPPRRRFHPRTAAKLAWPRFWARQFDTAICWWLAAGIAASIGIATPLRGRDLLIAVIVGPILVGVLHLIYEVLMVTALGTTVGKSLFGLRVETLRGKRADFAAVFRRSTGAWLRGSYAYLLFPLATLLAWKKSRDELRSTGLTPWDALSETEVTGPPLPVWHLSAGAVLAIAAFGMVLTWQTMGRGNNPARAEANASVKPIAAGPIQQVPAVSPSSIAPTTVASGDAKDAQTGVIRDGRAIFPANAPQKSFALKAPPGRPAATKSAEALAMWAEHTYPYLLADGPERRAMFAWMVAGTRVGLSRGAALALGIDTVISGRENGHGVCWPADPPPPATASKDVASHPEKGALGIRCER